MTHGHADGVDAAQEAWLDDATMAVVAHGLLGSMSLVLGHTALLRERWDDLPMEQRDAALRTVQSQATFVVEVLKDLARGLPPDVDDVLRGGRRTA